MSRVSVREALAGLEALGVIKIRHGKGAIVQERPGGDYALPFADYLRLYRSDIVELLKVRRALDELAATEAAENRDTKALRRLREAAKAFNAVAKEDPPVLSDVAERDEQFHLEVALAGGGKLLPRLIEELNGVLRHSRQLTLAQDGQIARSVKEHGMIVDAIASRDAAGARSAAGNHIGNIIAWLAAGDAQSTKG